MIGPPLQSLDFGYLNTSLEADEPRFKIMPRSDFATSVAATEVLKYRGWIYAPMTEDPPYRAVDFSTLPTHRLEIGVSPDPDLARFLVVVLGFLNGVHVFPDRWLHYYRAAIEPALLVDFYITTPSAMRILNLALDTFLNATDHERKLLFGAVHWYLFSERYEHPFERFGGQYKVLDTCWRIHADRFGVSGASHSDRPAILSAHYGMPLPAWGVAPSGQQSDLAKLRNEFDHEGLFAGEPIGLAHPADHPNIALELRCLNSRFLLALLSEQSAYVRSPVDVTSLRRLID